MKANEVQHIQYTKATSIGGEKGEVTERYIVPTFVPSPNIKAIDVSDLDEQDRNNMAELMQEYAEYHKQQSKVIPSFEVWLEQSQGVIMDDLKWRTFKVENVELLEE